MLEKIIDKVVIFLLKILNTYHDSIKSKYNTVKVKYQFLTPNDEAENIKEYSRALTEALSEKKVRNIAVSGLYGSGKSSFIKSFEKNNRNSTYKFLDISLARFNKKDETNTIDISLIEKSILEQMFYRVKSNKIPQSRLSKINRLTFLPFKITSSLLVIWSLLMTFKSDFLLKSGFFKNISEFLQKQDIEYLPVLILLIGAYFFIQKLFIILSNTSINKINLKDLELVSNDKNNESLLNRHLDEILYFFEKTSFNVVVFQDLDRFENLDIFTKLRELNNFLNNSEQINRDIKFIYAVKDEMFCNANERTKFFDFVVPIIPYINATNSKEKLLDFFQKEVKTNFLYDISLYISDMRLLKNIYNEYEIYSANLDTKINKTELLAMIIYKNFEPQDFEKLHKYEGLVYSVFKNKDLYIQNIIGSIKDKIKCIKDEIHLIDQEVHNNIAELQKIYLFKIIENLNSQFNGVLIVNNNQQFSINNISDDSFNLISKSDNIKSQYRTAYGMQDSQILAFQTIEKQIHDKYSYEERKQFILGKTNNKKNNLLNQIKKFEDEINEIENYNVKQIINQYKNVEIFNNEFKDKDLLKYLISYGHINKDYDIYMSNFFGISISKNDNDFLLNIKNNGKHFDFNYELKNIQEILKKERLEIGEFKKEAILNFQLVSYIINNKTQYTKQYIQIFKQLSNGNEPSIEFIFTYMDTQSNMNAFIQGLIKYYPFFWEYTINNKRDEEKSKYFYLLLDNLEDKEIFDLDVNGSLTKYIESLKEFYSPSVLFNNRLTSLIKVLNIQFKFFKEDIEKITPFKFIYENNLYELNREMIDYVVYVKNDFNSNIFENLYKAHYTTILNSKAEKLKQYIAEHINEYIENVYLNFDTNLEETERTIVSLLNNEEIEKELKVRILQKQNNKVSDINLIKDKELWFSLFEQNSLFVSWNNILYYYCYRENNLDTTLINYLNVEENYIKLSASKINNEKDFDKNTILQKFNKELILCEEISIDAYNYLIKSTWFIEYPKLNIEKLNPEKIDLILEFNKLKFNQNNIDILKEYFSPKHILFLEKNINHFIKDNSSFSIDNNDITMLLESKNISEKNKRDVIELIDASLINSPKMAKLVYTYVDKNINKSYEYIKNMISQLESTESKINLLVEQVKELNDEEFVNILELMPDEYKKIAKLNGKQTVLTDRDYNKKLVNILYLRDFITSDKLEKKGAIRLFIKNKS